MGMGYGCCGVTSIWGFKADLYKADPISAWGVDSWVYGFLKDQADSWLLLLTHQGRYYFKILPECTILKQSWSATQYIKKWFRTWPHGSRFFSSFQSFLPVIFPLNSAGSCGCPCRFHKKRQCLYSSREKQEPVKILEEVWNTRKQHFTLNIHIHISSCKAQRKYMNRKQITDRENKPPSFWLMTSLTRSWQGLLVQLPAIPSSSPQRIAWSIKMTGTEKTSKKPFRPDGWLVTALHFIIYSYFCGCCLCYSAL